MKPPRVEGQAEKGRKNIRAMLRRTLGSMQEIAGQRYLSTTAVHREGWQSGIRSSPEGFISKKKISGQRPLDAPSKGRPQSLYLTGEKEGDAGRGRDLGRGSKVGKHGQQVKNGLRNRATAQRVGKRKDRSEKRGSAYA